LYLYFTTLKSHFSILTTHFYKTTPIPFSILQYITLKYYKIIPFFIYFFSHPNQTHGSRSAATPNNPHTHAGKPKPKPTTTIPTPANPNPPQPILSTTTSLPANPNKRGREIRSGNPITAGKPKHKPHHRRQTQTETPSPPRTTITNRSGNNPSPKTTNPQPPPPSR
jgi:hypothetical protein